MYKRQVQGVWQLVGQGCGHHLLPVDDDVIWRDDVCRHDILAHSYLCLLYTSHGVLLGHVAGIGHVLPLGQQPLEPGSLTLLVIPVSYTHLDVYKRQL